MDDPELYHKAEHFKADMQNFFDEYKAKIRFRHDRKDSLLDIGCAGGNITIDVILSTLLPEGFSRLVGIDISRTMINYANEHFKLPNVSFEVLDIGGDITDFLATHQCFDHITSTLCLHLVPDQQRALQNIYNLLQPNGDCLLYIITDCFVFDAYGKMDKKWLKYMEDADDYISPYYRRLNPEYLLKKYLKNAGFTRYEIQMRKQYVAVDDVEKFKESFSSIIPFLHRMSPTEKEEFTEEFVDLCLEMTMEKNGEVHNGAGGKIDLTYTLMTAFAEKT
ncbi:juvenile hormone acid O-methyltransferase-like [Bradysia coprophila]|uniref:juvenile hormone acid O-methyltransferase-like n=1 Tax=Bradysia coprophila TaxID=38358 RepID=UPI00187D7AD0|nr:juvenile hormone acid O-methyltransferase-like [Bradysia coprophila]